MTGPLAPRIVVSPSGDEFYNAAFGAKVQRVVVAPSGAIFKGRASPPFNLPTPIQGVGGERSETEGGGCIYGFVVPFFAAGCSLI